MTSYWFIAGAPRSGTTFLAKQLGQHSQVELVSGVASYFFMDEPHPLLNPGRNIHQDGIAAFPKLFSDADKKIKLDGTDHLMYQLDMLDKIALLENMKMVFILREPAGRIYSSFKYTKYNLGNFDGKIDFKTYTDALLNQDEKSVLKWTASEKRSGYVMANELKYSNYYFFIEKWIRGIGRENCELFFYEDLKNNKHLFFESLLEKLNISDFKPHSSPKNESSGVNNLWLHRKIMNYSHNIPASYWKERMKKWYWKIQGHKKIHENPTDGEALQALRLYFAEYNRKLSEWLVGENPLPNEWLA